MSLVLLYGLAVGCVTGRASIPQVEALRAGDPNRPVILVPGITGSKLVNIENGTTIWGEGAQIFSPRDGGYSLARSIHEPIDQDDTRVEALEVLDRLRLFGGLMTKEIYRPIWQAFEAYGYQVGDLRQPSPGATFYTFAYDWRGDNVLAARHLRQALERLAHTRGVDPLEVDLICQSNGAHICRYLAKYGGETLERAEDGRAAPSPHLQIHSMILVGTSNGGAIRVMRGIHRGRRYAPVIGRLMRPEVPFSMPALFQDMPHYLKRPFVDASGNSLDLDIFDADVWVEHGWSVFNNKARQRMANRPDLFGDEALRVDYLRRALDRGRRLHTVLARDVDGYQPPPIRLLQNGSDPTPSRAVVFGDRLLFSGDPELDRLPGLKVRVTTPGDGHAPIASQMALSPQELGALVSEPFLVKGKHFELILEVSSLRYMLESVASTSP